MSLPHQGSVLAARVRAIEGRRHLADVVAHLGHVEPHQEQAAGQNSRLAAREADMLSKDYVTSAAIASVLSTVVVPIFVLSTSEDLDFLQVCHYETPYYRASYQ